MSMQLVFIHGGTMFPSHEALVEHLKTQEVGLARLRPRNKWSSTLPTALGPAFDVLTPHMPLSNNAPYELWKLWFERCCEVFTDDVVLVGHSLGGIFLAKYLSEHTAPIHIHALFLVAAPYTTDCDGELPAAWHLAEDLSNIPKQVPTIHIYQSADDPIVPADNAQMYQQALPEAQLHLFEDRGHFLGESFPELIAHISALAGK